MTYVSLYLLMVVTILSYSTSTLNAFTPYIVSNNNKSDVVGQLYMSSTSTATEETNTDTDNTDTTNQCEVLLLDHLNINHEKGRHDALKAFYFDFLGMAIDPRKFENYESGKKVRLCIASLLDFF